ERDAHRVRAALGGGCLGGTASPPGLGRIPRGGAGAVPAGTRRRPRGFNLVAMLRGLLKNRMPEMRPHPGPSPEQAPAAGGKSGALRAAIFGINDGLVSNLSLIMGVTGAAVDNKIIVIAGVAGLLAGAFSMAGGEYI